MVEWKAGAGRDARDAIRGAALSLSVAELIPPLHGDARRPAARKPAGTHRRLVVPGSLPRRSAFGNANAKKARVSYSHARRRMPRLRGRRRRAATAVPDRRGGGRHSSHHPGGRYFISRPGWIDSEPYDGISAAGDRPGVQEAGSLVWAARVTAQFPRPIYSLRPEAASCRAALPQRPPWLLRPALAAGAVMAGMSSRQGGRRPGRRPRRLAQMSPPYACGSSSILH